MHPSQGENLSQSKFELFRQKTKRSISFEREEKLVDGRVQGVLVRLIIEK
jgi:hypothetical protein